MPQLDLTELEAKVLWLILDRDDVSAPLESTPVELSLFAKVYRAYRGMPEKVA